MNQEKIFLVFLDFFPDESKKSGWYADEFPRTFLGKEGLSKVTNLEEDDIIVYNDADEVPDKDVLLFLKLYDGFTEPIVFAYR